MPKKKSRSRRRRFVSLTGVTWVVSTCMGRVCVELKTDYVSSTEAMSAARIAEAMRRSIQPIILREEKGRRRIP